TANSRTGPPFFRRFEIRSHSLRAEVGPSAPAELAQLPLRDRRSMMTSSAVSGRALTLAAAFLMAGVPVLAQGPAPSPTPMAEASPAPQPAEKAPEKAAEPFAFADFSWIPGNYGPSERPLATKAFTGEFRADVAYHHSFNKPQDNTISGSSEVFRHGEFQLTQLGIGGDFNYKNVQGRLMTQFGMYSQ